jgi:plasmid replication initiation protein
MRTSGVKDAGVEKLSSEYPGDFEGTILIFSTGAQLPPSRSSSSTATSFSMTRSAGNSVRPSGSHHGDRSSSETVLSEKHSHDGPTHFDESDIVVKANQLIRGRINWTKLEHRVVAMLVAQLKQEDESFEMQRVHISELMDMAQVSSRDIYDRAEEVCRKLLNQKVHVRTLTEDGRRVYQGYNCLSTCRYVEGSGYIEAKFNDDMKPFLLQLKRQFTMYRLQNFMQLGSQHSMRVYELIKMREGLRYLCVSVEELREVLCCEHTYDRFSDFKRYVLERARTEIADTCDVYFTYKVDRDGRTPVRVHFLIHQRKDQESENQESEVGPPTLIRRERDGDSSSSPHGSSTTGRDGSQAPVSDRCATTGKSEGPSSPPRFNLYGTVLSGLTQEELDDASTKTVGRAIQSACQEAGVPQPERSAASEARNVARAALAELRGEKRPADALAAEAGAQN